MESNERAVLLDDLNVIKNNLKEILAAYELLQAKCDKYEAALKEIRGDGQKFIPAKHDILSIANEALSAG